MAKAAAGQFPVEAEVFHEILKESSVHRFSEVAKVLVVREEDLRVSIRLCLEGKAVAGD